ncbi:fumarylacetoacetate hydrolase family protein [Helicovermis profundi]|uniref:Fumarylacetoacetate hydrolase family protein n=1 Tax=Helicovermis profundi TaxID=3065157 RepID=A0AAU9E478_9FIRM|nr:fumarylacetoacetate hydrolase family protein [Clostridia bacterium S502]
MYFCTYNYKEVEEVGILDDSKTRVISLNEILINLNYEKVSSMNDFIDKYDENTIIQLKRNLKENKFTYLSLDDIKLCAPIPYPKRNIICLGKNYIDHANEIAGLPGADNEIPRFPIYFSKLAFPAIGQNDIILNHKIITDKIDYEVELAIIIGKDGINIKKENVEEYIFGYTIINDISARNLQRKHSQWFRGKSLETFCPMGPYIVCKSQIPFPVELDIKCSINGELRQNSNTRNLIFDISYIISDLSKGMKLKKGDIIITGTPAGVGLGFKPYKMLHSGDVIESYIEKIGTLINYIE